MCCTLSCMLAKLKIYRGANLSFEPLAFLQRSGVWTGSVCVFVSREQQKTRPNLGLFRHKWKQTVLQEGSALSTSKMMIEDSACVCKATWLSKACCIATALLFAWSALLDLDFYRLRSLGEKKYIHISHTHIYIFIFKYIFCDCLRVYDIFTCGLRRFTHCDL